MIFIEKKFGKNIGLAVGLGRILGQLAFYTRVPSAGETAMSPMQQ